MPTQPAEWALFIVCMLVLYAGMGLLVGLVLDCTRRYKVWANTDSGIATIFVAWPILLLVIVFRFIVRTIGRTFVGLKGFK